MKTGDTILMNVQKLYRTYGSNNCYAATLTTRNKTLYATSRCLDKFLMKMRGLKLGIMAVVAGGLGSGHVHMFIVNYTKSREFSLTKVRAMVKNLKLVCGFARSTRVDFIKKDESHYGGYMRRNYLETREWQSYRKYKSKYRVYRTHSLPPILISTDEFSRVSRPTTAYRKCLTRLAALLGTTDGEYHQLYAALRMNQDDLFQVVSRIITTYRFDAARISKLKDSEIASRLQESLQALKARGQGGRAERRYVVTQAPPRSNVEGSRVSASYPEHPPQGRSPEMYDAYELPESQLVTEAGKKTLECV